LQEDLNLPISCSTTCYHTFDIIGVRPLNRCYGFLVHIKRWCWDYSTTLFWVISVFLSVKS